MQVEHPGTVSGYSHPVSGRTAGERLPWTGADHGVAFDRLFREHRESLLGFLFRRLRSREDAEDAVMLTFFKAWRAWSGFRGETTEKRWLYGIAARVAIDLVRARGRRPSEAAGEAVPLELADGYAGRLPDPADALLEAERRAEVRAAIQRLAPEQRRLLELYYFDGYRFEEISSVLGIPYTQVRGRLHRIRQLIRQDLAESRRPV